jgi:hypothetical protein
MHNVQSCEGRERKREGQHIHLFSIVKEKIIQVGWMVL